LNSKKSLTIIYKHQQFLADTCAAWTNRGQIHHPNAVMLEIITRIYSI